MRTPSARTVAVPGVGVGEVVDVATTGVTPDGIDPLSARAENTCSRSSAATSTGWARRVGGREGRAWAGARGWTGPTGRLPRGSSSVGAPSSAASAARPSWADAATASFCGVAPGVGAEGESRSSAWGSATGWGRDGDAAAGRTCSWPSWVARAASAASRATCTARSMSALLIGPASSTSPAVVARDAAGASVGAAWGARSGACDGFPRWSSPVETRGRLWVGSVWPGGGDAGGLTALCSTTVRPPAGSGAVASWCSNRCA